MNNRLVLTCIHIMNLLPADGLHVNKIISQTSKGKKGSPDRSHALEAIETLEKGNIAFHERWSHGKPKVIKLTPLGNQIKDLMNQLSFYRESSNKFDEKMKDQKKEEDLGASEYSDRSTKVSINLQNGRMFVESIIKKNIMSALVHRYSVVHHEHKQELNEISNEILVRIISNEFTHQLLEKSNKNYFLPEPFLDDILTPVITDIEKVYTSDFYISSWKYGKQELKDVLSRILSVAKISDTLAMKARTHADYSDSEKIKMLYDEKSEKPDYLEYVVGVLQSFNPRGYSDLPHSEVYREKDKEELIGLYKNLTE